MSKTYKNGFFKKNPYKSPKIRIFEKIRTKICTSGNTVIVTPSEVSFVSIDEFVDACSIPHQVLFDGLPLRDLSLVLVRSILNLCTSRFTVDFVITFCAPYTTDSHRLAIRLSQNSTKCSQNAKNESV